MFNYFGYTQASMLLCDFTSRLRQLNGDLYVKTDQVIKMDGLKHSGIYLKMIKQSGLSYDTKGHGAANVEKFFAARETGQLDKYMCGVCIEWLPEFDIFNADYTKIAVPGWRSTLLRLIQSKAFSLQSARKVFNCSSLGETDYDRMSFFNKMQFAKRIDLGEQNA